MLNSWSLNPNKALRLAALGLYLSLSGGGETAVAVPEGSVMEKPVVVDCPYLSTSSRRHEPIYTAVDFPKSGMWKAPSEEPSSYSEWAARLANFVAEGALKTHSLNSLFSLLADARVALQASIDGHFLNLARFGVLRSVDYVGIYPTVLWVGDSGATHTYWKQRVLARFPDLYDAKHKLGFAPAPAVSTYQLLEGTIVDITGFGFYSRHEDLVIFHPVGEIFARVLNDVRLRLMILQRTPQPNPKDFFVAMRGFYNALPYYRGNAAIGRSAFAGLYVAIFGRKLITPEDVDMVAIVEPEAEYMSQLLRLNRTD